MAGALREYKGKIDEQFAFLAFRTAPLVSATTMDAKVVTADMANKMMVWAAIRQTQPARVAARRPLQLREERRPLSRVATTCSTARRPCNLASAEQSARAALERRLRASLFMSRALWKGWMLPASDADTWFVAGSAAYQQLLASERLRKGARCHAHHIPRPEARARKRHESRMRIEQAKGVLFLDALRRKMGDDAFFKLMSRLLRREHHEDRDRAIVPRQGRRDVRIHRARRRSRVPDHAISDAASPPP